MLHVGVEDGGYAHLCMVCSASASTTWHAAFYVVLWDRDGQRANALGQREGGCLRVCWEHLDELAILIAEVL
jgi:hypothetical protein